MDREKLRVREHRQQGRHKERSGDTEKEAKETPKNNNNI